MGVNKEDSMGHVFATIKKEEFDILKSTLSCVEIRKANGFNYIWGNCWVGTVMVTFQAYLPKEA